MIYLIMLSSNAVLLLTASANFDSKVFSSVPIMSVTNFIRVKNGNINHLPAVKK